MSVPALPPAEVANIAETAATAAAHATRTQWSPGAYALYAILALMVPLVVAALRYIPTMRKLKDAADGSLRTDLMKEVKQLRRELREEQADCVRRTTASQNKMDAMIRQFVSFQIVVVRSLPEGAATRNAQDAADRLMSIIAQPVEDFAPARIADPEADEDDG